MVSPRKSHYQYSPFQTTMPKHPNRFKPMSRFTNCIHFIAGIFTVFLFFYGLWSSVVPNSTTFTLSFQHPKLAFSNPSPNFFSSIINPDPTFSDLFEPQGCAEDPPNPTFYDDPHLSYSMENPMTNWDEKRRKWLEHHPMFATGVRDRILMVTGSQPSACKNPVGDYFLLRFFKNKVDYCRIHGYELYYNNAFLHPKMKSYWAKLPLLRAAMIAHPEAEWIWWVDSDAAFTDMEFKVPLERYKDHNFVINGWPNLIYEEKSWVGVNAGIFLIRNCQWSMDFLDAWAGMGPQTPDYERWGKIVKSILSDKLFPELDDQSTLVYFLLKENEKWGNKIYVENKYALHGYWEGIVGTFGNVTKNYDAINEETRILRRKHAEKARNCYGDLRDRYLKEAGYERPAFVTHFTGCRPCSGDHNDRYSWETCSKEMERALNFADNQVLRSYGYVRKNLLDTSTVSPLASDFPVETTTNCFFC